MIDQPNVPLPAAATPAREAVSRDLSARAAGLAHRLADVIEATCTPESGAPAAVAFLRDWATSALDAARDAPVDGPVPLEHLVARAHLGPTETDLLLLAGLPEEHEGLASTFRTLHPRAEPRPSVGLALLVAAPGGTDRAALRRLLHEGAAVRCGALALVGDGPFHERCLALADTLWDAMHGHDAWPSSVRHMPLGAPPAGLRGWLEVADVRRAAAALGSSHPRTLLVSVADEVVALSRCAALAQAAGVTLVAGRARPDDAAAVGLLGVHAAARGGVPVLVGPPAPEGTTPAVLELSRLPGPVVVCAPPGAVRPGPERPVLSVPPGPIGETDRRQAWRAALPDAEPHLPALAAHHPLDPAITAQVALDLRSRTALARRLGVADRTVPTVSEVSGAIRERAGILLPAGVDLVRPRASWDRLVLAADAMDQLRDAVARLRDAPLVLDGWGLRESARADRGVRLLFTGPPGTGKSLAAEVVATEAGTDLLTVDVSNVVSKWIGETEKNLAGAFDAAERTQAVLFLDEADALFGARTEVSDAHDRYANLETSYLLQRLDRFDGIAVLATNLRQNIDPAFTRRMDFVVEFGVPDLDARRALWDLHLPRHLRGDDVDLAALAGRYRVPGGWIRNAAVAAAFRAAAGLPAGAVGAGGPVRQDHLVAAMRREYAKASQPFPGDPPARAAAGDQRAARALDEASAASARPPDDEETT